MEARRSRDRPAVHHLPVVRQDRYGLRWQIVPARFFELIADPDAAKAARVTRAMFGMTKFDIAALENAYAGG